jgi:hypothetical protein
MTNAVLAVRYRTTPSVPAAVREPEPLPARPRRLLDRVRDTIRARHYSRRTEKAYVGWIRRYIFFHGKRHPAEMGAPEITAFLSSLAVQGNVAASTQNQALSALLFLTGESPGISQVCVARAAYRTSPSQARGAQGASWSQGGDRDTRGSQDIERGLALHGSSD